MNESDAVVKAKRKVYCIVSLVMFTINLLLLAVVGLGLPLFYAQKRIAFYQDMGMALPILTQAIITYCSPMILLLATGFLGTVLVVKEILAAPQARFWVNVVTLLLLVFWGISYVYAVSLPSWSALRVMQGP